MKFSHAEDLISPEPESETRKLTIPSEHTFMRYRNTLS